MSTKIGVVAEGPIDLILLTPLLSHIARVDAGISWPVEVGDAAERLPVRKRGHGGVLESIRALVEFLSEDMIGYHFVVIMLDRRTEEVQREIRSLIAGKAGFVLGIAIEEIEARWLGDRTNTLKWAGFTARTLPQCRYGQCDDNNRLNYAAEKDHKPKRTLHELTVVSESLDSVYGDGNTELATRFAGDFWQPNARIDEIKAQCPKGFGAFRRNVAQKFRSSR